MYYCIYNGNKEKRGNQLENDGSTREQLEGRYLGGPGGGKLCNSISIKIIKAREKWARSVAKWQNAYITGANRWVQSLTPQMYTYTLKWKEKDKLSHYLHAKERATIQIVRKGDFCSRQDFHLGGSQNKKKKKQKRRKFIVCLLGFLFFIWGLLLIFTDYWIISVVLKT